MSTEFVSQEVSPLCLVVITPARNEEKYIGETIDSVIRQTLRPERWVIVDDCSTDATGEVVKHYSKTHPWIELVTLDEGKDRSFSSKVWAFNAGKERVKDIDYDLIASLDADITLDPDLFQFLASKFEGDPRLGLAGVPFSENGTTYDFRYASTEHVSGALQMFRVQCFEEIGGYQAIRGGGIDVVAVLTSRMKGWKTQSFIERHCVHHRPMGTAKHGRLRAQFFAGRKDYYLGGHPLWQMFRCSHRFFKAPLGALMLWSGYLWGAATRVEKPVSKELVHFRRAEQITRLRLITSRLLPWRKSAGRATRTGPTSV